MCILLGLVKGSTDTWSVWRQRIPWALYSGLAAYNQLKTVVGTRRYTRLWAAVMGPFLPC